MRKRIKPITIAVTASASVIASVYCSDKLFNNENNSYFVQSNQSIAGIDLDSSKNSQYTNEELHISKVSSDTYLASNELSPTKKLNSELSIKGLSDAQMGEKLLAVSNISANVSTNNDSDNVVNNVEDYIDYSDFVQLGVANVSSYLNVREKPDITSDAIGKMPPHSGCTIISQADGWAYIRSGKVTGYVSTDYLLTGDAAISKIKEYGRLVIKVDCDLLNVRKEPSIDSDILAGIWQGEKLDVLSSTKDWVNVEINNYVGYVARDYVSFTFALDEAVVIERLPEVVQTLPTQQTTTNNQQTTQNPQVDQTAQQQAQQQQAQQQQQISQQQSAIALRNSVVNNAMQYLGSRYVLGGNSLATGTDCSGFTMLIYAQYGYSLPRIPSAQAACGTAVNPYEAQPGDLVFYSYSGGIGHVGICIGNGQIIHDANSRDGVKISNMFYTTPAKVVRLIN